tara:strand:+ start:1134 stop:1535 length:402 start_codon:yes stop_codon:yes gene_type:complete
MAKKKKAEKPKEYTITDRTGQHTFRLAPPASPAICTSIVVAASSNQIMGLSAALGACWRGAGKPEVKASSFEYNFLNYGRAVFDELHARGVNSDELMEVSTQAYLKCLEVAIPAAGEVEALADFIEGREESTL